MRTRICFYILLFVPLVVYWQTAFHEYGFRDDYSYLRESREEPAKMVRQTASHGRPLYGALLETTYAATEQVTSLNWMRLTTIILLILLGIVLWRQLYQSGWNEVEAAVIGLGVTLLPSSQFVVGAALAWPQALTLLLAMAGFSAIETEIERGGLKRAVALLGGCMIYTVAALIYQSNVLFALVPITAVYVVRTGREPLSDLKWLATHLATMFAGLLIAYLVVQALFHNGVFEQSARMKLEGNLLTKLLWFTMHPLPNALALFALADDHFHGVLYYAAMLIAVVTLLVVAYRRVLKSGNKALLRKWQICLFALPFVAQFISLVAAERTAGYRVLFSLSALVLVMVMYAVRTLLEGRKVKTRLLYASYGVVALILAAVASRQSFQLMAEPQALEWSMMKSAVLRADFSRPFKAYVIAPGVEHRTTDAIYQDEFGSLSSNSDSVPQEMFKAAVRFRYPDKLPKGVRYQVDAGHAVPAAGAYEVVVDMRNLKLAREP
jgi:hypothetical protein